LRFRHYLLSSGCAAEAELSGIEQAMKQEIVDAVQFAKDSPMPDPATALDYIYA
jgi:pyruvate dehydrogenase E1 component alpha subunit